MTQTAMIRRVGVALIAIPLTAATLFISGGTAGAAAGPTVQLGTAGDYSVLGASTVTNVGDSVLHENLGLSPGSSITGFPPGEVVFPATTETMNEAAAIAQANLTAAYLDAKLRPVHENTPSELANLELQAGVYAGPGPGKAPLTLNGPLTLDGAGDPTSVFIFQTDSSLITGFGSTVNLINGAQECNVFWQVGSSATLGASSDFSGNILAITSIWFTDSVTVHGRALATTGEVTLINDTFVAPTCDMTTGAGGGSTTTTPSGGGSTTTTPSGGGSTTTTPSGGGGSTGPFGGGSTTIPFGGTATDTGLTSGPGTPELTSGPGTPGTPGITSGPGVPPVAGPPRTGGAAPLASAGFPWMTVMIMSMFLGVGMVGSTLRRNG